MTGVASFRAISEFIPGLTEYRYTVANFHCVQYGRNAPVPTKESPRLRIDPKQVDHFLGFITSPHLVQDLPFGEKHLQLSSGKKITVPNVIRTMIPERLVIQYTQYCCETNYNPFSRRTMLRMLSECSASVHQSLQGLDYFGWRIQSSFCEIPKASQCPKGDRRLSATSRKKSTVQCLFMPEGKLH